MPPQKTTKTPRPRKPNAPNVELRNKTYGGTLTRLLPEAAGIKCVTINHDHPLYGQDSRSQYVTCDHQGARVDGFNVARLTWEQLEQLLAWRQETIKWQVEMRQWCLDNGVPLKDIENEE